MSLRIYAVAHPIDKRTCPPLKDETVVAPVVVGNLEALQVKSLAPESGKADSDLEVVELYDLEEVANLAMVVLKGMH